MPDQSEKNETGHIIYCKQVKGAMVAGIAFLDFLGMPEECPIVPDAGHFILS
ncbi:MAG: hypothetical protein P4L41_13245 [Flavipsychrobacter sp.]|nr:hypothetical protein [Flavipsychrobacter sp.]